jgi:hypothetical protein
MISEKQALSGMCSGWNYGEECIEKPVITRLLGSSSEGLRRIREIVRNGPIPFFKAKKELVNTNLNELSINRRKLVSLMLEINFGQIEDMHVRGGDPQFDPPPSVTYFDDFDKDIGPHPFLGKQDFALKKQVVGLFKRLDKVGDGKILSLVVQNGLPVRMKIVKTYRA